LASFKADGIYLLWISIFLHENTASVTRYVRWVSNYLEILYPKVLAMMKEMAVDSYLLITLDSDLSPTVERIENNCISI